MAATSLLIDYVLTVAVSVVAGVAAITSACRRSRPMRSSLSLGFVVVLTAANLRGVKESGRAFAIPTYGFVLAIYAMLLVAFVKLAFGDGVTAESAHYQVRQVTETGGLLTVFLVLRAFASGCTALTGVEAVSNGVPGFEPPKSRNAATTLLIMGVLATTMFAGITALALLAHVHMAEDTSALIGFHGETQRTALSQIALATFGNNAAFFLLQGFTAAILILAANTAFNGFPVLVLAAGPRRLPAAPALAARRPARLLQRHRAAGGRGVAADRGLQRRGHAADPALHPRGLPLVHAEPVGDGPPLGEPAARGGRSGRRGAIRRKQAINALGAVVTGLVFVIVLLTKFAQGAWIVVIAAPILFAAMKAVAQHYRHLSEELSRRPPASRCRRRCTPSSWCRTS